MIAIIREARTTIREARPRRLTNTLLWAGQILLAIFMFVAAAPKLTGSHASVQEFGLIGAGQWFRSFVGVVELAGAIGLLTPWLAGLAPVGLAADMIAATIVNATVLRNTAYDRLWLTIGLGAVPVPPAYGRRRQIRRLAPGIRR